MEVALAQTSAELLKPSANNRRLRNQLNCLFCRLSAQTLKVGLLHLLVEDHVALLSLLLLFPPIYPSFISTSLSSVFNDCSFDKAPSLILFSSLRSVIIPASVSSHQSISPVNPLLLPLLPPFNHSIPSPVLPSGCQGNSSLFCGRSSFDIVFLLPAGQIPDKEDKRWEDKERVPVNAPSVGLCVCSSPERVQNRSRMCPKRVQNESSWRQTWTQVFTAEASVI